MTLLLLHMLLPFNELCYAACISWSSRDLIVVCCGFQHVMQLPAARAFSRQQEPTLRTCCSCCAACYGFLPCCCSCIPQRAKPGRLTPCAATPTTYPVLCSMPVKTSSSATARTSPSEPGICRSVLVFRRLGGNMIASGSLQHIQRSTCWLLDMIGVLVVAAATVLAMLSLGRLCKARCSG